MGWQPQDGQPQDGPSTPPARFPIAGIVAIIAAVLLVIVIAVANAGGQNSGSENAPAPSATQTIPFNVSSFLTVFYNGSNKVGYATHSPAWHVENMTGDTQWIGSNTLPGTLTIGAPNAQGAVMVTWIVRGQTFKWLVSQNGQYAVPQNARSWTALGG